MYLVEITFNRAYFDSETITLLQLLCDTHIHTHTQNLLRFSCQYTHTCNIPRTTMSRLSLLTSVKANWWEYSTLLRSVHSIHSRNCAVVVTQLKVSS